MAKIIHHAELTAHVSYDDTDPNNRGWFAVYMDAVVGVFSDSMKVGQDNMPRRRDAEKKALRIALGALKKEVSRRAHGGAR